MLRQVRELPKRNFGANLKNQESPVCADVREFVRKGMDVAAVEVRSARTGDMRKETSVAVTARRYIERAGIKGVAARSINGTCYLVREDGGA